MGQRIIVDHYCDMTEAPKHDDAETIETVAFSVDNERREIDLCKQHRAAFDKAVAPYMEQSRKTIGGARVTPIRRPGRSSGASKEQLANIRQWAKDNGKTISDRGRIPEAIFTEYQAAH